MQSDHTKLINLASFENNNTILKLVKSMGWMGLDTRFRKGGCKRNFKWPFMQWWQSPPIHNGSIKSDQVWIIY